MRIHPTILLGVALSLAHAAGAQSPAVQALRPGDHGPALSFRLLSGGRTPTWNSLEGKAVVIDFWATWCKPCVAAIPKLNELHRSFADKGIAFYSVTYEPDAHVLPFLEKHPIESDVAIDDSLDAFRRFQAWGIPVAYLFDRAGNLVATVNPNDLTADVLTALQEGRVPDVKPAIPWKDPAGAEKYFGDNQRELREKAGSTAKP